MSKNIATPIDLAISAIKTCARLPNGRINWSADKSVMSKVAIAILSAPDTNKAIVDITAATGVQSWTMKHFIRGNNASGGAEQEVRDAIKAAGLAHVTIDGRKRQAAPATKNPADAVPPADFTVTPPGMPTTGVTVKPATLAVTNKGEVITATPPAAATTPTTMVAQGGDFAVKQHTTRCVIDANTCDILVITTRRIMYGSADHRAKMIEMNSKKG